METTASIDLSHFNNALGILPDRVVKAAMRGIAKQLSIVQKTAKQVHRFMSTSGVRPSGRYYRNTHMLERSIQIDVSVEKGRGIVYLEKGIAPYGVYIHEGFKSWSPDQFVYKAFDAQKPFIAPAAIQEVQKDLAYV